MRYSRSLLFPKEGFLFPGIRSGGLATSGRRKIFPYRAAQAESLRPHSHSRPGKVRRCVGRNRPTRSVLPEIPGGITSRRIYRNVCFGKISQNLRRIRSGQGRVRRARTPRGNRSACEPTTPHRSVFPVLRARNRSVQNRAESCCQMGAVKKTPSAVHTASSSRFITRRSGFVSLRKLTSIYSLKKR